MTPFLFPSLYHKKQQSWSEIGIRTEARHEVVISVYRKRLGNCDFVI